MMTVTRRRVAVAIAAGLALVLALLAAAPFLLRGRIDGWLQQAINERVDAHVTWERAGLSLFRGFPNASLRVEGLSIVGQDRFAEDTLALVPRLSVEVELPSLLRALRGRGPLQVRSVEVDRPAARLLVLEDGTRNWDVLRETDAAADDSGTPLELTLRKLEVRGARVVYEDRQAGLAATLVGLDQSLRGDFRAEHFDLDSRTRGDSVSFSFADVPYLSGARLDATTVLDVDAGHGRIAVRSGELRLNDLVLALSGDVELGEEATDLNLTFRAPGTSIRELVSLVTPLYADGDLARAETSGTMSVAGWVRGRYGEGAFPAFALDAQIDGGALRYPDFPLPVSELALDLGVRNPGGDLDSTRVELRRFRAVAGQSPVEGAFTMRTPVSDPAINLHAAGRLDLAEWSRALPLASAEEELSGVVAGELRAEARASDIEAERYDRIAADGTIDVSKLVLRTAALPHPLAVEEARLRLSPRFAELAALRGTIGSSDFAVTGRIDNPLGYALRDEELRGTVDLRSRAFDLNEWKSDDELQQIEVPERIDLTLTAAIDRLAYADLDLRNARGTVRVRDRRATLDGFALELFGGTLAVDGYYETIDPERPAFDVALRLAGIDVAQAGAGLVTMQAFAPVVRYATGRVSTELRLSGALGEGMAPLLEALSGQGSLATAGLALQGFPALERLAERLQTERLRNPALSDVRASFHILDGRLHVRPFDVELGQFATRVGGSQGIDGTMEYALELRLPRALLGTGANQVVASLAERAAGAGIALEAAEEITLGATLGGTVTSPSLALDFRGASGVDALRTALRDGAEQRIEAMAERVDSVALAARQRAEAQAAQILAEAERQAEAVREQARALAEAARREGHERADALAARDGNPVERRLAQTGAERLRAEADRKADEVVRSADVRADALLEAARERAQTVRLRAAMGAGDAGVGDG
jgi:hypothetical protein